MSPYQHPPGELNHLHSLAGEKQIRYECKNSSVVNDDLLRYSGGALLPEIAGGGSEVIGEIAVKT